MRGMKGRARIEDAPPGKPVALRGERGLKGGGAGLGHADMEEDTQKADSVTGMRSLYAMDRREGTAPDSTWPSAISHATASSTAAKDE